jgi:hypothetical protein
MGWIVSINLNLIHKLVDGHIYIYDSIQLRIILDDQERNQKSKTNQEFIYDKIEQEIQFMIGWFCGTIFTPINVFHMHPFLQLPFPYV